MNNAADTKLVPLMTRNAVAGHFGVTISTLLTWARKGKGPRVVTLGRRAYYTVADVLAYTPPDKRFAEAEQPVFAGGVAELRAIATRFGMAPATVGKWLVSGNVPRLSMAGPLSDRWYSVADINAWIERSTATDAAVAA